jgi:hypothetical protein
MQPLLAEHLAARVQGLGDAIGEGDDPIVLHSYIAA